MLHNTRANFAVELNFSVSMEIIVFLDTLSNSIDLNFSSNKQKYILSYVLEGSMCVVRKWAENNFSESAEEISELLYQLSDLIVQGVSSIDK